MYILSSILCSRYAYIDQDEDVREHKPVAPKFVRTYLILVVLFLKCYIYLNKYKHMSLGSFQLSVTNISYRDKFYIQLL